MLLITFATNLRLKQVFRRFFSNFSFAQDYAYHKPLQKGTLIAFMAGDKNHESNLNTVSISANAKLQQKFNQRFKNAGQVDWYNLKKDYLAVFDYQGRKTRALFTKNGYNIYVIAYGAEKDLPKDYRHSLKSNYVDYDILNAIELHSAAVDYTTWLALLRNDDKIVIARIVDGSIDEFARYSTKPTAVKKQRKGRIIIPKSMSKN